MPDDITPASTPATGSASPHDQELDVLIENTSLDDITIDTDALAAAVNDAPLPINDSAASNETPKKNAHSLSGIEDISSYIEQKKQEQLKKPSSEALTATDGTDLTKLANIYAIVPHTKGDHKLVYFRTDVPTDVLDDEKGRTKGSTYVKNGIPIYTVHVDMKRHAALKGSDQQAFDVRVIDSPNDLDEQIEAIQKGKGGGANFGIPIMVHPERAALAKKQAKQLQETTREEAKTEKKTGEEKTDQKAVKKTETTDKKAPSEEAKKHTNKKSTTKEKSHSKNPKATTHQDITDTSQKKEEKERYSDTTQRSPSKNTPLQPKKSPQHSSNEDIVSQEHPSTPISPEPSDAPAVKKTELPVNNENGSVSGMPLDAPTVVESTEPSVQNTTVDAPPLPSSPTAAETEHVVDSTPTQSATSTVFENAIVDPEDEKQKKEAVASSDQTSDDTKIIASSALATEQVPIPDNTEEGYSNRLSPFQDAPTIPQETPPPFSLTEDDLDAATNNSASFIPGPRMSTVAPASDNQASENSGSNSDTEEHHLFKPVAEDSETINNLSENSEIQAGSMVHTPQENDVNSDIPDITTMQAIPDTQPTESIIVPEDHPTTTAQPTAVPENAPESPSAQHTVLDLDSLDLGTVPTTPAEPKNTAASQATVSVSKTSASKKVPSASSLKTMSIVLRVGGLALFFGISVLIRNIMFPASNDTPPIPDTPVESETGDAVPTENPLLAEQPIPQPDEEIPTEPTPSEETPTDEQPVEELPQQQYTIPELIKKMEAQELDARRLLNKAKLLGNRDAIKFATAALLKAGSAMEKAEKDSSITADELQEDATRIDLYLQQASSLLE